MTEQSNPSSGQAPQESVQQPPAAPLVPQQAFGDAPPPPVAPGSATFGDAPPPPAAPGEGTFGTAPAAAATAGEAFGNAPAPEKKKGGLAKIIGTVVAVLLALGIAGVVYVVRGGLSSDDTKAAAVGDCIATSTEVADGEDKQADDAKVVACTDADALYKVEGRLENKTEAEARNDEICAAYAAARYVYRAIPSGGKGYVLCLSQVKK